MGRKRTQMVGRRQASATAKDPGETSMCEFDFGAGLPVANTVRLNEFQRHRGPDGEEGYGLPTTNGLSSGIAA